MLDKKLDDETRERILAILRDPFWMSFLVMLGRQPELIGSFLTLLRGERGKVIQFRRKEG